MVQQSALRTQDPRLIAQFERYRRAVLECSPPSPWQPLFNRGAWMPVRPENVEHLSYYYLLILLHGLTCDPEPGSLPLVRDQMQADFCPTWDPRPVDVYLQRVLMLVESGQPERVKPVWLQRVLDAQLNDGGWSDFYPLLPLGKGRHPGFSGRIFSIKQPAGSFHATAQGTYLLSLMQPER